MHRVRLKVVYFLGILSLLLVSLGKTQQTASNSTAKNTNSDDNQVYIAGKEGTSMPTCYYFPQPPAATKEAQAAKFVGTVVAEGTIATNGQITDVNILRSPGLGLDESVIKTMKTWKCRPAKRKGRPVTSKVPFEIHFRLD